MRITHNKQSQRIWFKILIFFYFYDFVWIDVFFMFSKFKIGYTLAMELTLVIYCTARTMVSATSTANVASARALSSLADDNSDWAADNAS